MHSQTVRYARNGALGAIALYLLIAVPLLGLSMHSGSSAGHSPGAPATAPASSAAAMQTSH